MTPPQNTGILPTLSTTVTETPRAHAPRGPLKGKSDPIRAQNPISQTCRATNNRGNPCKFPAIPGGAVCRFHGGNAPQVRAKAEERLLALQHPAIDRMGQLIEQTEFPTVAYAASRDVLDRTLGKPTEKVETKVSGRLEIGWMTPETNLQIP